MNRIARKLAVLLGPLLLLRTPRLFAQPTPAAVAAFNSYATTVESRLAQQHRSAANFLTLPSDPATRGRLQSGEFLVEKITTPTTSGALIHHWRATAFVLSPRAAEGRLGGNVTPADFERLLRDFSAYPHNFAPQIVSSTVLSHTGIPGEPVSAGVNTPADTLLRLRTRQHHVITVVLDTTCDVTFASLDVAHGYSISRSTHIDQIAPAGDDGFLYRLNTYWSYEQRDGGLYIQLESLSLTRSVPRGLAWAVQPYLESIPRESLIFTLASARNALRKPELKTAH